MTVTDEMVEKAHSVFWKSYFKDTPAKIDMRAALEAVAPMLIAQGMREAASMVHYNKVDKDLLLARAQELDQR